MAGLIQRAVAALYVSDSDTSRVRDNIVTALNPVLTFLTTNFGQNDFVLRILKPVEGLTSTWRGLMTLYGNMSVMGAVTVDPVAGGNAFVVTTVDGKTIVFRVTDSGATTMAGPLTVNNIAVITGSASVGGALFVTMGASVGGTLTVTGATTLMAPLTGTSASFSGDETVGGTLRVTGSTVLTGPLFGSSGSFTGTVSATNVVSAAGFPDSVPAGVYFNSTYGANNLVILGVLVANSGGLGGTATIPFMRRMPRNGSIIGYSLTQLGANAGTNMLYIYKNNQLLFSWSAGAGGNNTTYWGTQAKGALPFVAGDLITTSYASNAAGAVQVTAHLTFEMSA